MQRFVLILDASIANDPNPEWVHHLYIEHLPYSLRLNIALLTNEWVSMDEFQSKITSLCDKNTNIEELSFTTFASIIHNSCCDLKQYINNNNNNYKLELIWRFPTFNNKNIEHETLHNDLMILCGAFQRWIECNNGHIHIFMKDVMHDKPMTVDSVEINLCDVNAWKTIFADDCTVWRLKGMQNNDIFNEILIEIIKPHRLNTVRLKMQYSNDNTMDIDTTNDEDNDNDHIFNFDFDLIPTSLCPKQHELMWKHWDNCYDWNTIKLLNVTHRDSFPVHLLISDIKSISEYTQNEPILLILNAQNETAKLLTEYWINDDENKHKMRWIVQFMNDNDDKKCKNMFMTEDDWMNSYTIDDDEKEKENDKQQNVSSKYLIYSIFIENEWRLIAHKIMNDEMNTNLLNLTYKYSSMMNITSNDDKTMIKLPYFRFNPRDCDIKSTNHYISIKANNEIKDYNGYLLDQHSQYIKSVLWNESGASLVPTPSTSTTTSTSSSFISSMRNNTRNNSRNNTRKRRRRKSVSNRGLIAVQNAAKQSNIIHSAHLSSRKKCLFSSKKRIKNELNDVMWLNKENIWRVFDGNGELRDKMKEKHLENISMATNGSRRDWRELREMAKNGTEMSGNWPNKSRFYNEESLKYEEKISNIKKQYVNGSNNGNDNSFEIIGDLVIKRQRAITIKCNVKKKSDLTFKQQNKRNLQSEIEALLRQEINKNVEKDRYRNIRTKIFDAMWGSINKDRKLNCDAKISNKVLRAYVTKNFAGMFLYVSSSV